jgi:hypothetical protein
LGFVPALIMYQKLWLEVVSKKNLIPWIENSSPIPEGSF